jgi:hypothetical protein
MPIEPKMTKVNMKRTNIFAICLIDKIIVETKTDILGIMDKALKGLSILTILNMEMFKLAKIVLAMLRTTIIKSS